MHVKANYLAEFPKIFWTMVLIFFISTLCGLMVAMFYSYALAGFVCSLVVLFLYFYTTKMQSRIRKELTIDDSGLKLINTKFKNVFKYEIERYILSWSEIDDVSILDKKKGPMIIKTNNGDISFQIISKPEINKDIVNEIEKYLAAKGENEKL